MRIVNLLLFFLLVSGCSKKPRVKPSGPPDFAKLEQVVWHDYFAAQPVASDGKYFHLDPKTHYHNSFEQWKETVPAHLADKNLYDEWRTDSTEFFNKEFDTVSSETISGFIDANAEQMTIPKSTVFSKSIIVDYDEKIKTVFRNNLGHEGWEAYYAKYPKGKGRVHISRVGFNTDGTEALIYVGYVGHVLVGSGWYILMRMEDGKWIEKERVAAWIS